MTTHHREGSGGLRRKERSGSADGPSGQAVDRKFRKELSSGITSLALLAIMDAADEPMYGYSIAKQMEDGESRLIKHGAIYPVLRALESHSLLESRVEPSVSGPPRRYYGITEEGRMALLRWSRTWEDTVAFMSKMLGGTNDV